MTLLLISPDYASHALPLLTIAGDWQRRGHRVVVASGPAIAPLIRSAGMEHAELIMSRGSNPGLIDGRPQVAKERSSLEAFFAAFPAGTVSGAPKIRAMEIIDDLEPTARGVYAGAILYADFAGNLDSCIAIRTIVMRDEPPVVSTTST